MTFEIAVVLYIAVAIVYVQLARCTSRRPAAPHGVEYVALAALYILIACEKVI